MKKITNKKGMSILDVIASILIISLAMTTITSLMVMSLRTSIKAKQKLLSENVAEMYSIYVTNNLPSYDSITVFEGKKKGDIIVISSGTDESCKDTCLNVFAADSIVYRALYDSSFDNKIVLNGKTFDCNNTRIEIKIKSATYKTVIVTAYIDYYGSSKEASYSNEVYIG